MGLHLNFGARRSVSVFQFIEANYHQLILCNVAEAVGYFAAYLTDLVVRQVNLAG